MELNDTTTIKINKHSKINLYYIFPKIRATLYLLKKIYTQSDLKVLLWMFNMSSRSISKIWKKMKKFKFLYEYLTFSLKESDCGVFQQFKANGKNISIVSYVFKYIFLQSGIQY